MQPEFSLEDISHVAREALKGLIAQGKAPIPPVYEAAFVSIAEREGMDGLVEFLYTTSGHRFSPLRVAEEVGGIITSVKHDLGEYGEHLEGHNNALKKEQENINSLEEQAGISQSVSAVAAILQSILYANELMRANLEKAYEKLQSREVELRELQVQNRHDPMTGALNRRALRHDLDVEIARFQRYRRPFSIAMADLDHFKEVNDRYGHLVGDEVLKGFAFLVKSQIRQSDCLYRYGGEEFVILLRETELKTAGLVVERIRRRVAEHVVKKKGDGSVRFTVSASFGVTAVREGDDAQSLLQRADRAMLAAKAAGRNQVVVEP